MKKKSKQFISLLIVMAVLCFTFLGTLQVTNTMEAAAKYQVNLIESSVSFIKARILKPYLSVLVNIDSIDGFMATPEGSSGPLKAAPVREKRNNKLIQQIFFILSTVIITQKDLVFLLIAVMALIASVSGSAICSKKDFIKTRMDFRMGYYISWILKFLNPLEKYLMNRSNEYDIEHVIGFPGKRTRTLNCMFGVRVFFMDNNKKEQ